MVTLPFKSLGNVKDKSKSTSINITSNDETLSKSKQTEIQVKSKPLSKKEAYLVRNACIIRDLIIGECHDVHSKQKKETLKSLSKPNEARQVIQHLKSMEDHDSTALATGNTQVLIESESESEPIPDSKPTSNTSTSTPLMVIPGFGMFVKTPDQEKKEKEPPSIENTITLSAFWWGYQIIIPHSQMKRLEMAQNITAAVLGFLSVLSASVPQIKPFLTYISAWVGLEFTAMKSEDLGNGIIIEATWLLPIALVPTPR